jgi:hypothetical protein
MFNLHAHVIVQLINNNAMVQVHTSINPNMIRINNQQQQQQQIQLQKMTEQIEELIPIIQQIIIKIDKLMFKIPLMMITHQQQRMIIQVDHLNIQKIHQQDLILVRKNIHLFLFFKFMFLGLLGRSNSYNGLQSGQAQPRVISAKQRNTSGSNLLYPVHIHYFVFSYLK